MQVGVEGLQTLKPHAQRGIHSAVLPANGIKGTAETFGGINIEVQIVTSENDVDEEMVKWVIENVKFSVKQPVMKFMTSRDVVITSFSFILTHLHLQIEAIVTKDELQHLAFLFKSEVDSMGRITAGILRLLKLEGSIGQAAMDQLSNLGMLYNL